MRRREFLQAAGFAAAGITSGCAARKLPVAAGPPPPASRGPMAAALPRPLPNLALPRISWDRVIRTTIGLRPHRDSGFVLRPEKFDGKTVIHNYGFGGAGMSLAWGCGLMAAEMALEHGMPAGGVRRAAVLGCGSPGLTAARQLQRRGFQVVIYAASIPPNTTSNMSLAGFTPTAGLVEAGRRTPGWDAQFRRAAELSYTELQLLAGAPGYGVYWIDSYNATADPRASQTRGAGGGNPAGDLLPDHLNPGRGREIFGPGEHPFPAPYAVRTAALAIEPSIYLQALVRDFILFGGSIVIRKFDTPRDLMLLAEPVLINCTGLGSKTLFNDQELVPVRGQLTHCIPQPEVRYRASGRMPGSSVSAGINPRSDGLCIGNMAERGNWSLEPDEEVRRQNVEAAMQFFGQMRPPSGPPAPHPAMSGRSVPAIESFYGVES
ncbi:MAG: FAD-dependent oxidoreductase [Bryobacterales bacterium]|nr:FAD-dependent oxidoreductase [Bryobacterales bacterium]